MENFVYINEMNSLTQILILGMILSAFVCFTVEKMKILLSPPPGVCMAISFGVSAVYSSLYALTFGNMRLTESLWLMVFMWLSSQGLYEYLKTSEGYFGKMFMSVTERNLSGGQAEKEKEEYMIFPVNYVGISGGFTKGHPAVDFGFSFSHGGKNQDIIAPCDMKITSVGEKSVIGKYIRSHAVVGGEKYTFRFIHLSEVDVKKGDEVKMGEIIGKMGNTGSSSEGHHLHFDIWKGHTEDISSSSDRYERSIDPVKVCRLGKGQTVGEDTKRKYEILKV